LEILKKIDSKNEKVIKWKSWRKDTNLPQIVPTIPTPGLLSCWL